MPPLEPIVESRKGELSFLLCSEHPGGPLRVRWREPEFPSLANMQTVLDAHRRAMNGELEPYGLVRVCNNLAAAHICNHDLAVARDLLAEAEEVLVGVIRNVSGPESQLAVSFAVLKYNACVLLERAGDDESRELAALNRQYAMQALGQVAEGSENHLFRFVTAALAGLGG